MKQGIGNFQLTTTQVTYFLLTIALATICATFIIAAAVGSQQILSDFPEAQQIAQQNMWELISGSGWLFSG